MELTDENKREERVFANFNKLINHKWQSKEIKVEFQFIEGCFSYKINEEKEKVFSADLYHIEPKEKFLVIRDKSYKNMLLRIEYKSSTSIDFSLFEKKSVELEICY